MDGFIGHAHNNIQSPRDVWAENLGHGITARLANTTDLLQIAGVIRHNAYAAQNFIEASADGVFLDDCDYQDNSHVIIAYRNGVPVGTARVCLYAPESGIDGADSIPVMEVFGPEIFKLFNNFATLGCERRAIEVMRLATVPSIGFDTEILFALYLMAGYITLHYQVNAVICAVRRHHMPFYRRLGLLKVAEPRAYPKLKFQTGLVANVQRDTNHLKESMPILHPISLTDSIYPAFMAGNYVSVFEGHLSPEHVVRLLSGQRNAQHLSAEDQPRPERPAAAASAMEIAA